MGVAIGVDIGGTRIKAGVVDASGNILEESVVWMQPGDHRCENLVSRLETLLTPWVTAHGHPPLGVGIPGVVDIERGVVTTAPNFPDFQDFPIREVLTERLGTKVYVDNDAHCVLAGEWAFGTAKNVESAIGFTLGTGVGGAILLKGEIWRGLDGMAGELGHLVVDPNGPACACGGRGCLEQYASTVGLRRMCVERPVSGIDPESADLPRLLFEAAEKGDEVARAHFRCAGESLGAVIGGLLNTLNVHTVVLAGGIASAYSFLEEGLWRRLQETSYAQLHDKVDIRCGELGAKAGILGAAHLSFD